MRRPVGVGAFHHALARSPDPATVHAVAGVTGCVAAPVMDALIEQARASGVRAISLTTGVFNDAALHLYRRRGFAEVLRRGEGVQMVLVMD